MRFGSQELTQSYVIVYKSSEPVALWIENNDYKQELSRQRRTMDKLTPVRLISRRNTLSLLAKTPFWYSVTQAAVSNKQKHQPGYMVLI